MKKQILLCTGLLAINLCACSTGAATEEVKTTEQPTITAESTKEVSATKTNSSDIKEPEEDYFKDWFDMGTFENLIEISGEKRDKENVTVQEDYCILPKCSIATIMGGTIGRPWEYPNISEKDARKIVDLLEKSKLEDYSNYSDEEREQAFSAAVRLSLVILNSKGEYSQVILHAHTLDKIQIELRPSGEQKDEIWYTAPNKELVEIMKKYMNYRLVSDKEIEDIAEIEVSYKNGETKKLDEAEVEEAKKLLKKRERTPEARDYESYDIPVVAKTSDGEEIRMFIYEKQGEMIIEGGDYDVSRELLQLLMGEYSYYK